MTIKLYNLRYLGLNVIQLSMWWIVAMWEKALGWPVLSLFILALVAHNDQSLIRKTIMLMGGLLFVAGWYGLPASIFFIWLGLVVWLGRSAYRLQSAIVLAWLGAGGISTYSSVPSDAVVSIYLLVLLLLSLFVIFRYKGSTLPN